MFNKSKKTAFSTVNVDELLINEGAEVNHEAEAAEPAPVIEKVTLKEIKEEQSSSELDEALEAINKLLSLSPEERKAISDSLLDN